MSTFNAFDLGYTFGVLCFCLHIILCFIYTIAFLSSFLLHLPFHTWALAQWKKSLFWILFSLGDLLVFLQEKSSSVSWPYANYLIVISSPTFSFWNTYLFYLIFLLFYWFVAEHVQWNTSLILVCSKHLSFSSCCLFPRSN